MNIEEIKRKAKEHHAASSAQMAEPWFQNLISWLVYLGLLHHNTIVGQRHKVTLADVLRGGELEPRILEILPALLFNLPEAIIFEDDELPEDLSQVLSRIRRKRRLIPFRGIDGLKYGSWLHSKIFELASKKLYFHKMPRIRLNPTTEIGATIRTQRIQRALTQQEFAKRHGLPLRIIRDLEQGRNHASLSTVIAILAAFDLNLSVT